MKESLFIKLVKYIYGINKPFDKFAKKIIYEASFKVAVIIMPLIFVSSFASLGLINLYDPSLVLFIVTIFNIILVLIALLYMEIVVKHYGLDDYVYSNDYERKIAIRSYIIKNIITLLLIVILIIYVDLCFNGNSGIIFLVVYAILFIISRYLDYRRKFK